MKLTANSNPIIPKNTVKGINVTKKIRILLVNNLNKKDDRIANKVCPATFINNNLIFIRLKRKNKFAN